MKGFKRNAVIITVLLFVGAAVYLNWAYGRQQAENTHAAGGGTQDTAPVDSAADGETGETGLFYESGTDAAAAEQGAADRAGYFDQVRLNRQQARDEAAQTLSTVSQTDGASQESVDAALNRMMQIADWTAKEAELESMIAAKGFEDCVVFISEDGVTVTVAVDAQGLSTAGAAQITDLVTGETDCSAQEIKIIEIK